MLKRIYIFACFSWAAFVVFVASVFHTGRVPILQELHGYFFMLAVPILIVSVLIFGIRWVITGRME